MERLRRKLRDLTPRNNANKKLIGPSRHVSSPRAAEPSWPQLLHIPPNPTLLENMDLDETWRDQAAIVSPTAQFLSPSLTQRIATGDAEVRVVDVGVSVVGGVEVGEIGGLKECTVCRDEKFTGEFPRLAVTDGCTHPPGACLQCVGTHIRTQMETRQVSEGAIACPECPTPMDFSSVRRYADYATFSRYFSADRCSEPSMSNSVCVRYEWLLTSVIFDQIPNFFRCANATCDSGQIHESGEEQPIVTCISCTFKSCFRHKTRWHATMTCEEYDGLLADPEGFRSNFQKENERAEREQGNERRRSEVEETIHRLPAQRLLDKTQRKEARRKKDAERLAQKERDRMETVKKAIQKKEEKERRERIKRDAENARLSVDTIERTTKKCPGRACGAPIEKNNGWYVGFAFLFLRWSLMADRKC